MCKRTATHTKSREDLIAEFEIITGEEFDPGKRYVLTCDECEKGLREAGVY